MKEIFSNEFYDIVKDTQTRTGLELPVHIEAYIVMLLSSYVERDDIPPACTFAEIFMTIKTSGEAKELGDMCLFVSGVFPLYKKRYGINRQYYQDIGSTSYDIASDMNAELFPVLSKHFVFLSNFIDTTVNSSKDVQNILFR
jgi:hypothetical protein